MTTQKLWGVFPFDPTNYYRRETVVHVYKRRSAADDLADRLTFNPGAAEIRALYKAPDSIRGFVVREYR